MPIEFERSGGGLYVPADTPVKKPNVFQQINSALGGAWLTTSINALMVLIQLFTVVILWLTYENTVIPTRQKELLSEQLAQLELERKKIIADIEIAKQDANTASKELLAKQEQLVRLTAERERLQASVVAANRTAESSLLSANSAIAKANAAGKELSTAQLSLFQQHASMIVGSPQWNYSYTAIKKRVAEANAARDDSDDKKDPGIDAYLREAQAGWPDISQISAEVATSLRKSKSPLFPQSLSEDLAKYMLVHTKGMTCPRPDFIEMRRMYDEKRSSYIADARAKAEKEDAEYVANGLKKGIRYVFSKESLEARESMSSMMADYTARDAVRERLDDQIRKCFAEFEAVGEAYFKEKKAVPQLMPEGVNF